MDETRSQNTLIHLKEDEIELTDRDLEKRVLHDAQEDFETQRFNSENQDENNDSVARIHHNSLLHDYMNSCPQERVIARLRSFAFY